MTLESLAYVLGETEKAFKFRFDGVGYPLRLLDLQMRATPLTPEEILEHDALWAEWAKNAITKDEQNRIFSLIIMGAVGLEKGYQGLAASDSAGVFNGIGDTIYAIGGIDWATKATMDVQLPKAIRSATARSGAAAKHANNKAHQATLQIEPEFHKWERGEEPYRGLKTSKFIEAMQAKFEHAPDHGSLKNSFTKWRKAAKVKK
jgi:hypothetical protein